MKCYDYDTIKDFFDEHNDEIKVLYIGMAEDWTQTCSKFTSGFDYQIVKKGQHLFVRGIPGSTWATPVMKVVYKNGLEEILPCWFDDGGATPDEEVVAFCKGFAKTTFGGDSVYD